MADERPEKGVIREMWVETITSYQENYTNDGSPLYLTLSGAEARDIRLLAERHVIELTEVGAIATESQGDIVAVERSSQAVAALQRAFPGLKIISQDFKGLIRGETLLQYPEQEHRRICRSRVINLDFNGPLECTHSSGFVEFNILKWVRKIATMQAEHPRRNWALFLTLNGTITWDTEGMRAVQQFLSENFQRSAEFADACNQLMGEELYNKITANDELNHETISQCDSQRILMSLVPKKIAQLVHAEGWRVETRRNLRYGGTGSAPMVTWMFDFVWDARASSTPQAVYLESLLGILTAANSLESDGSIDAA